MDNQFDLTWDKTNQIIENLISDKYFEWALLVGLGVNLPIKIKEMVSLRWEDLYDFKKKELVKEFKLGSKVFVVNGMVKKYLSYVVDSLNKGMDPKQEVFTINGKIINGVMVTREFKRWEKRYSLEISPTDLRKIFARRVIEKFGFHNNVLLWLKSVLGQKNVDDVVSLAGYVEQEDINLEIISHGLE